MDHHRPHKYYIILFYSESGAGCFFFLPRNNKSHIPSLFRFHIVFSTQGKGKKKGRTITGDLLWTCHHPLEGEKDSIATSGYF